MPIIDDEELRSLFDAECEEHLAALESGLLSAEGNGAGPELFEALLREAHSLKGAARMLSLSEIEAIAHRLEDLLRSVTQAELSLQQSHTDACLASIDALRKLCAEAVTGRIADVDVQSVLASLDFAGTGSEPATTRTASSNDQIVAPPLAETTQPTTALQGEVEPETPGDTQVEIPEIERTTSTETGRFRLGTIRLAPERLDQLMEHANELVVNQNRLEQRPEQAAVLRDAVTELIGELTGRQELMSDAAVERLNSLLPALVELHQDLHDDEARFSSVTGKLEEGIRAIRMLPLSSIFSLFPRLVRDLSNAEQKKIELVVEGADTMVDKLILEEMKDPVMHLIRNAVSHGIEDPEQRRALGKAEIGTIKLSGHKTAANLIIEVTDDGRGLDQTHIKAVATSRGFVSAIEADALSDKQLQALIFRSGFSTQSVVTDLSGRGVGLDVVHNSIEGLNGTIEVSSTPGAGCVFKCIMPLTLTTTKVILIKVASGVYGIPIECVESLQEINKDALYTIEDHLMMTLNGEPIPVGYACTLLELSEPGPPVAAIPAVIIKSRFDQIVLMVDEIIDEQEVVLKPVGPFLKRVRNVAGSAILSDGAICSVLNPADLVKSLSVSGHRLQMEKTVADTAQPSTILLAEDSMTTRTQEKRILESAGYKVIACVDGADAMMKLGEHEVDAVVSDVDMPRLNGFQLTMEIRKHDKLKHIPVILVTSLSSDEDRQRGLEAGASAYLVKSAFDQQILLDTLQRLVGY